MSLVKLNWNRLSVGEKLLRARFIVQSMGADPTTFASPNPTLQSVSDGTDDLQKKAVDALAGGIALTLAKSVAEDALDALITQLVPYVQNISNGNEQIILAAGMEVRKKPSPNPAPLQVQNLSAFPSKYQGSVDLNWNSLGNRTFYQIEMQIKDDNEQDVWIKLDVTSKSKFTVDNLETGQVMHFRVAGIGSNDEMGPYSQTASSVVP